MIPSLCFVFVPADAALSCAHCGESIDLSDGKPLPVWGMNDAPLHRSCADAYIREQGWVPAFMPGINIYVPDPACGSSRPTDPAPLDPDDWRTLIELTNQAIGSTKHRRARNRLADLRERLRAALSTPRPETEDAPDEELTPHPFSSRTPYEPGDDRDIWCRDCEYHRDHAIHAGAAPRRADAPPLNNQVDESRGPDGDGQSTESRP